MPRPAQSKAASDGRAPQAQPRPPAQHGAAATRAAAASHGDPRGVPHDFGFRRRRADLVGDLSTRALGGAPRWRGRPAAAAAAAIRRRDARQPPKPGARRARAVPGSPWRRLLGIAGHDPQAPACHSAARNAGLEPAPTSCTSPRLSGPSTAVAQGRRTRVVGQRPRARRCPARRVICRGNRGDAMSCRPVSREARPTPPRNGVSSPTSAMSWRSASGGLRPVLGAAQTPEAHCPRRRRRATVPGPSGRGQPALRRKHRRAQFVSPVLAGAQRPDPPAPRAKSASHHSAGWWPKAMSHNALGSGSTTARKSPPGTSRSRNVAKRQPAYAELQARAGVSRQDISKRVLSRASAVAPAGRQTTAFARQRSAPPPRAGRPVRGQRCGEISDRGRGWPTLQ